MRSSYRQAQIFEVGDLLGRSFFLFLDATVRERVSDPNADHPMNQ